MGTAIDQLFGTELSTLSPASSMLARRLLDIDGTVLSNEESTVAKHPYNTSTTSHHCSPCLESRAHSNYSFPCCVILLTYACLKENGTSIWSHHSCVAAATCQGTTGVITLNQCQNPNVLAAGDIPNLAFTIYTNIVGSCAPDGCPITQQNYIDFIYGAMSAANTTEWPSSVEDVITHLWQPILDWTATGATIPYTNFNDWLHWSNS
ncbi:hypothetical protein C8R45DRAFT_1054753 [Mycena sanguinolenta]|nr:hypothetical protein C8R45DRAFT_1054753 [Mycena sanguinolenta]